MLARQVLNLSEVLVQVIKLPAVGIEILTLCMAGDRLPAAVPDRAVASHLEVLGLLASRQVGPVEGVRHADTVQRHLRVTRVDLWRLHAQDVQQGGNHVTDMVILVTDAASIADSRGPVDKQGRADSAAMRVALEPLERRVGCLCPSHWIVWKGVLAADLVDMSQTIFDRLALHAHMPADVDSTGRSALAGGAVVR